MHLIDLVVHPYAVVLARWTLAIVFMISGVGKLLDSTKTVQAVAAYRVLPTQLVRPYAMVLPYAELAVGVALLVGLWTRTAALSSVGLLISFTIAVSINLARGHAPDCHCFGALHRETIRRTTLLRLMVLILTSLIVLYSADGYLTMEHWILTGIVKDPSSPPLLGLIPVALWLVSTLLIVSIIRQLGSLARPQVS